MWVSTSYKGRTYRADVETEYDDRDSYPVVVESDPPIGECGLTPEEQRAVDTLLICEYEAVRNGRDIDAAYERARDLELERGES